MVTLDVSNVHLSECAAMISLVGRRKKSYLSPREFIKCPLRREKKGLVSFSVFPCSVVLPEILGSPSVINRTSAEFF